MRLTGQRKLSGPGIKILDRSSMGLSMIKSSKKTAEEEESSDSESDNSDYEGSMEGEW